MTSFERDPTGLKRAPFALSLLVSLLLGSCASPWESLHEGQGWTLFVQDASEIESQPFLDAMDMARPVVEAEFGAFEKHVRVYAWNGGLKLTNGKRGTLVEELEAVENVPGIGPAKVQAFHARGGDLLGDRGGVFLGAAEVGTAVHELVHARLAEAGYDLPLWLEEGIATFLGDGIVHDGEWQSDGLACWHLRELSEEELDDAALKRLLELEPGDEHDFRDNVLVHFVGWAIVFDLRLQDGSLEWEDWVARYQNGITVAEARERMERSLSPKTPLRWLERLDDDDPRVRMAAVKGTWKLRSRRVAERLLARLKEETDPEVRASLAVNVLATAGEIRLGRRLYWWMWRSITPVLRDPDLPDPDEREAVETLYKFYRYEAGRAQSKVALERLSRFLEE